MKRKTFIFMYLKKERSTRRFDGTFCSRIYREIIRLYQGGIMFLLRRKWLLFSHISSWTLLFFLLLYLLKYRRRDGKHSQNPQFLPLEYAARSATDAYPPKKLGDPPSSMKYFSFIPYYSTCALRCSSFTLCC